MVKLTPQDINAAKTAVDAVKSMDETIERLGKNAEDEAVTHGRNVRRSYGENRLRHFTDGQLGEITVCAVINALLRQRKRLVDEHGALITFPEPPCPNQVPQFEL